MNTIDKFQGKYAFLSNFYPCTIRTGEYTYRTVEHAYQAQKFKSPQIQYLIRSCASPGKAKRLAGEHILHRRLDWYEVNVDIMRELLQQKFHQGRFKVQLLGTGDSELIEGNNWGDVFWGVCNGKGQNMLGKLLMELRLELLRK